MHYFFNHGLIDKRKPTAGVGCLELVMLTHEEKLALARDLINANVTDPSNIVSIINHLEDKLFKAT